MQTPDSFLPRLGHVSNGLAAVLGLGRCFTNGGGGHDVKAATISARLTRARRCHSIAASLNHFRRASAPFSSAPSACRGDLAVQAPLSPTFIEFTRPCSHRTQTPPPPPLNLPPLNYYHHVLTVAALSPLRLLAAPLKRPPPISARPPTSVSIKPLRSTSFRSPLRHVCPCPKSPGLRRRQTPG